MPASTRHARNDSNSSPTVSGAAAICLLESSHPELFQALQARATDENCTFEVSTLPTHSRRFLWQLYQHHDPQFAEWMSAVLPDALTVLGATLRLKAHDILGFLGIAPSDIQWPASAAISASPQPPPPP